MYCKQCGSQLPDDSKFCQFCGCKIETNANKQQEEAVYVEDYHSSSSFNSTQTSTNSSADGYATVGLILGALTFIVGVTCIPGLVFSIMGLKSTKNKGQAIAGLILSCVPFVLLLLIIIIAIIAVLLAI